MATLTMQASLQSPPAYTRHPANAPVVRSTYLEKSTPEYYDIDTTKAKHGRPTMMKALRRKLCSFFGVKQATTDETEDIATNSLAYDAPDDSFEAEMLEEDNMAWGRPTTKPKRESRKQRNKSRASGRQRNFSLSSAYENSAATCRVWR